MTDTVITVGVLLLWTATVAMVFYAAGQRKMRESETQLDEPAPLVAELTEEVRQWRAEAGHWKATAERLTRELDARG